MCGYPFLVQNFLFLVFCLPPAPCIAKQSWSLTRREEGAWQRQATDEQHSQGPRGRARRGANQVRGLCLA